MTVDSRFDGGLIIIQGKVEGRGYSTIGCGELLWILTRYRIVVIFSRTFHISVHGLSQIFKISNFEVFFQLELQTVSHKTSLFPNTHLVSLNHSFALFNVFNKHEFDSLASAPSASATILASA